MIFNLVPQTGQNITQEISTINQNVPQPQSLNLFDYTITLNFTFVPLLLIRLKE